MRVVLTGPVAAAFPETEIRLVAAHGLRNDRPWPGLEARLVELERRVAAGEWAPADESRPEIASWHAAFRRFGTNPRRVRPSVDALGRRLARTGRLPRVSPAVDAYNLVSVTRAVPVGAFDQRRLGEEVLVRYAEPGDAFTPLGEPETVERPGAGEVVYADGGGRVLTRHWNHRDADATKVTPAQPGRPVRARTGVRGGRPGRAARAGPGGPRRAAAAARGGRRAGDGAPGSAGGRLPAGRGRSGRLSRAGPVSPGPSAG